jgi:hypothetical protein
MSNDDWVTGGYYDPMDELKARRDLMSGEGYVPCSIPACNCCSWHRRDDKLEHLRAALREIVDEDARLNETDAEYDLDDVFLRVICIAKEALEEDKEAKGA